MPWGPNPRIIRLADADNEPGVPAHQTNPIQDRQAALAQRRPLDKTSAISEPGRMACDEAADVARRGGPAGAAAEVAGVEAQPVHEHERVARVGVDGHVLAAA